MPQDRARQNGIVAARLQDGTSVERRLDTVESVDGASVLTDPWGRVRSWSCYMERLLGFTAAAMEGRTLPLSLFEPGQMARRANVAGVAPGLGLLLLSPDQFERRRDRQVDLGTFDRRGRSTDDEATPSACDWSLVHQDGSEVIVSVTVSPLVGARGRLVGYTALCVDVTEARRTHSLLVQALIKEREASHRLAELDRERDAFVATASHELRTPVASILGYAELLEDLESEVDPQVRIFVSAIKRNADRLRSLSEDLLALSRSSAGHGGDRRPTDVVTAVTAAWDTVVALAIGRRLDLGFTVPEGPVTVVGEQVELERVVLNLVGNAIKFTPDGGRVHCSLQVVGTEARLQVSDTGVGVSAEDQRQLFSRFFRGAAARNGEVRGTGLGLSITRAIVEQHGGEVAFESHPGHGSTVTVRLPIEPDVLSPSWGQRAGDQPRVAVSSDS